MLLKVYKSRVWMLLLMLLPFIGNAQIPGLPPDWGFTLNPTSATYAVPTSVTFQGVTPLAAGDWIGVFYQDGATLECGGAIQWDGVNNVAVVAFGNDGLNPNKNGFADNEFVHWKFYSTATQTEICVAAYDAGNAQFNWVNGDLDAVAKFVEYPIVTCPSNMTGVKTTDPAFTLTGGLPAGGTYSGPGVSGNVFTPSVAGVGTHTITYTFTEFDCSDYCTFTIQVIPGTVTQTISYVTGWNWISFNVLPTTATVANVMANYTPMVNDVIKTSSGSAYWNGSMWFPPTLTIDPDKSYLFYSQKAAGSFNVTGSYVLVQDPINIIGGGWTWIGYKPRVTLTPGNALSSIAPFATNDVVKTAATSAYWNGTMWFPPTFTMQAGKGYKLYKQGSNKTLIYPASDGSNFEHSFTAAPVNKNPEGDPGWTPVEGFDGNLNVVVNTATLSGVPVMNGRVAAFDLATGQCRGVESFFDGMSFLTIGFRSAVVGGIPSELGQTFFYRVWNSDNDVIYEVNETDIYADNAFLTRDLTLIPPITVTNISGTVVDEITLSPLNGVKITATVSKGHLSEVDPGWTPVEGFDGNLNVVVNSATLTGVPVMNGKVAAFDLATGQCRGVESFFDGLSFLTIGFRSAVVGGIPSELGQTFFYRVWNSDNDVVYEVNETDVYADNAFLTRDLTLIEQSVPLVTYTGSDGTYLFEDVPDGTYTICTGPTEGYIDECANPVTVPPSAVVDFALMPTVPPCDDVVISNFPAGFDNLCVGTAFEHDFSDVLIQYAESVVWNVNPAEAGTFGGPDGDDFTLSTNYVGVVTISVTGYAAGDCDDATASLSFEVYPLPVVTCPNNFDVCIDEAPWALYGATPQGGDFAGVGVVDNWYYPELAGVGTHEITYTYTNENGCVNSCSFLLIVNALPIVECPQIAAVCEGSDFIIFPPVVNGVYTNAGGQPVQGFDPVVAGDFGFTLTVTDGNGCVASCEFTVVVNPLPDVTCPEDFAICVIENVQLVGGMPEGGVYTGDGVEDGVFYSIAAGIGPHVITYTYTDNNGCTNSCEFVITVNDLPAPVCPNGFDVCIDAEPVVLTGALPEGGTYGGDGVVDGTFFPYQAGLGYHELFYTYTDPQTGCTGFCVFGVTVNPLPEVECPAYGPFCEGDDYVVFEGNGVYTYNSEVVTGFNPVYAGSYLFVYTETNEFGCSASCMFTIDVHPLPVVSCPADFWVCLDEQPWALYGGEPEGGVYSDEHGAITLFDPSFEGVGFHEITYTYTDANGCTNFCTFVIEVKPEPVAYAGEDVTILPTVTYTIGDAYVMNADNWVWSTAGDGQFDDIYLVNPTYIPGVNDILVGNVVLTLTASNEFCGDAVDSMIITFGEGCINPPTAFAGEDDAICASDSYTLSGATATNFGLIQWYTIDGSGYFDNENVLNPTYYPSYIDILMGSVELCVSVTPADPLCEPVVNCMVLTINPLPVFECPAYGPFCEGGDEVAFEGEGVYTFNGQVVTGFVPEFAGEYIFVYTVTDQAGCSASCEFTIVVNPLPTLTEEISATEVCLGESITYTSYFTGVAPWTVEYTWNGVTEWYTTSENPDTFTEVMEEAGEFVYQKISLTDGNGCTAQLSGDPITIVVNPLPTYSYEVSATDICYGEEITYTEYFTGTAPWTVEYYWNGVLETYTTSENPSVSTEALYETSVYEPISVTDGNGCSSVVNQPITITVHPLPVVECPVIEAVCEGSGFVVFPVYEMGVYTNAAGEVVTGFDPVLAGTYEFTLTVTTEFGCSASCEFETTVNPLPVFECPAYGPFCEGSEAVTLEGPGVYTLDGVVITEFEPAVAGNYIVVYTETNEFGCSSSCEFVIVVNPLPTYYYEVSATEICYGQEVTYTEYFTGTAPWTVEYYWNGVLETYTTSDNPSITSEVLYETALYEPISVTDGNGCVSVVNQPTTLTVIPLLEITGQPANVAVLWGEDVEFTVVAENATGYQWFEVGVGEILGATGSTLTLENVTVNSAYYCVVTGECNSETSNTATLTILPWTQIIPFLGSVNGMSTYLDLINCDIATNLAPVGNNLQGAQFYQPSKIYAPGAPTFCWDEAKGAKVTLKNNIWPTSISVVGFPTLGTTLNLPAGYSIIPVWSQGIVNAADVFASISGQLIYAASFDYTGMFYPAYNIYSLQYLVPGNAYLVALSAPATINFDVPIVDATPGYVSLPPNMTAWDDVKLTAVQHFVVVTSDALASLQIGDVIGAFNQNGKIAGMIEVTNLNENIALRVYGDDMMSKEIDGFANGDMMTFRVYRNGVELDVIPTFDQKMPNTSIYEENGASAIIALKAGATGVNEYNADLNVNVYPNPATDFVNIQTNFEIKSLKVVNYVGQVVFDQTIGQVNYQINTSNFGTGMYFVQIEANDGTIVTKRLTIK